MDWGKFLRYLEGKRDVLKGWDVEGMGGSSWGVSAAGGGRGAWPVAALVDSGRGPGSKLSPAMISSKKLSFGKYQISKDKYMTSSVKLSQRPGKLRLGRLGFISRPVLFGILKSIQNCG